MFADQPLRRNISKLGKVMRCFRKTNQTDLANFSVRPYESFSKVVSIERYRAIDGWLLVGLERLPNELIPVASYYARKLRNIEDAIGMIFVEVVEGYEYGFHEEAIFIRGKKS